MEEKTLAIDGILEREWGLRKRSGRVKTSMRLDAISSPYYHLVYFCLGHLLLPVAHNVSYNETLNMSIPLECVESL